jgi:hypothetical protein
MITREALIELTRRAPVVEPARRAGRSGGRTLSGPYAQSRVQYGRNGLPHQATAGGQTLRYLYDHTGQRVYESGGSGRYTVRGVGGEVLAVYGGTTLQYHDLGVGRREASGAQVAYVRDHLGSVRVAIEPGGAVRSVEDYYDAKECT